MNKIEYLHKLKEFVRTWEKTQKGFPKWRNYPRDPKHWFFTKDCREIRDQFFHYQAQFYTWYIKAEYNPTIGFELFDNAIDAMINQQTTLG